MFQYILIFPTNICIFFQPETIMLLIMCPSTQGWASTRKRQYALCIRKDLMAAIMPIGRNISDLNIQMLRQLAQRFIFEMCERHCGVGWKAYLCGAHDDIEQ